MSNLVLCNGLNEHLEFPELRVVNFYSDIVLNECPINYYNDISDKSYITILDEIRTWRYKQSKSYKSLKSKSFNKYLEWYDNDNNYRLKSEYDKLVKHYNRIYETLENKKTVLPKDVKKEMKTNCIKLREKVTYFWHKNSIVNDVNIKTVLRSLKKHNIPYKRYLFIKKDNNEYLSCKTLTINYKLYSLINNVLYNQKLNEGKSVKILKKLNAFLLWFFDRFDNDKKDYDKNIKEYVKQTIDLCKNKLPNDVLIRRE